ncbi:MAG: hypothetical protein ACM3KR_08365 [Deltaproteobacteria bacterium]
MNRKEKERLARLILADACIIIVFLIAIAILVKGFGTLHPEFAQTTTLILGQVLLYTGLIACFIGFIKKKGILLRYSLESVIYGALILFLYYSFYNQKIMPNFGFIYYYSLLILGVLYIIVSIVYAVIKVRK